MWIWVGVWIVIVRHGVALIPNAQAIVRVPAQISSKARLRSERGTDPRRSLGDPGRSKNVMTKPKAIRRGMQCGFLCLAIFVFLGSGDEAERFDHLGHQLMSLRLPSNSAGVQSRRLPGFDGMRNELMACRISRR